ncbi:alanine racemase [Thauera sp. CAU 1555]|uniref:Alanine racemase n=1 Tax=Thauera sedimentorum TaxID=2767595 RepID=A0ABR9BCT6_9RHOO|nr:alanine racemase [Thauera sedimentorum]MBC9073240.1 alanine racemase [Thauera sedimentorum]MBD8504159.1 alanine racemase [Thauera sedimentorum]
MRPARALVDLDALRHNYRLARSRHGGQALAVVKANAYGHGAVRCAHALAGDADGFAVACLEEAQELRAAGITAPILLLEGVFEAGELDAVERDSLWMVVHHPEQLRMIEQARPARPYTVWLKVNSGMNRAGFAPEAAAAAWQRLNDCGKVDEITLMTHFARADEPQVISTATQIARFDAATAGLPGARSLANSAGVLGWPGAHRDWARPGILLYGADPMPAADNGLQPVMTLESRVMAVRELDVGEPLGYGARFHAERPTRVGLVAMGYADGYPRSAPDGTPVSVDGQPTRLIGRVSMDMLTVDLTELPAAGLGSRVELWGREVSVNEVAKRAGTIAYELLCNVKRVRFEYRDSLRNA